MPTHTAGRTWRRFDRRDGDHIERQIAARGEARCPHCGMHLVVRANTRLAAVLPRGARGVDLDCRGCRRFHSRIRHTPRSRYILRIQRLAAAVLRA
ncbi:MAG TPA: hypothetical protein VFQ38_17605 [Longimicrobiales bacterium]|nr:hypothetical protein [Longimicrobiales bacterium]